MMGSGSSKAASSSSSPSSSAVAASEAGGEVRRGNGSVKGRRARSLLPSSSCFRGSTTPADGEASPPPAVEVRATPRHPRFVCVVFLVVVVKNPKMRIRAAGKRVMNRGARRAFPLMECGYVVDLVVANLLLPESSNESRSESEHFCGIGIVQWLLFWFQISKTDFRTF